jgi:uncharacterized protein (DUF2147 family)
MQSHPAHRRLAVFAAVVLSAFLVSSIAQADVTGVWWTPRENGKIHITRDSSGRVSGRIIAGLPQDAEKTDIHNPDAELRQRRVLGLTMLKDFQPGEEGKWTGGTLYDPDSGQTYKGMMWVDGPDRLMLRGFVGITLLGRTETLRRVGGPHPQLAQPGEPALVHVRR